jgi:hypothetical protein
LRTIDGDDSVSKTATKIFGTKKVTKKGANMGTIRKEASVTKFHGKFSRHKKAVIAIAVIYSFLLCFMVKMAGIGATVSIFLFLGICSLPALLGRALGDKSRFVGDDDTGGYRYVYSYRYGSRFAERG